MSDKLNKQVEKSHYDFSKYMNTKRWNSLWHQFNVLNKLAPETVLEIGPGAGFLKVLTKLLSIQHFTLDLDSELDPDYVADVTEMPFDDNQFDAVCAFQILEHLPYEKALQALGEIRKVAKNNIVISLPDARKMFFYSFYIPTRGNYSFFLPKPQLRKKKHVFDGQHYWEINKRGYELEKVIADFESTGLELKETFRVKENMNHRFFIFRK